MLSWLVVGAIDTRAPVWGDPAERTLGVVESDVLAAAGRQAVGLQAGGPSGDVGGMLMAGVVLLALGLAGVAAWRADLSALLPSAGATEAETTVDASAESDPATTETADIESEPAAEPEPDRTERTDREIVTDILHANEGRMKQANIVDETGWSKSKVSMLLSEMEDDEEISKLRVGRENIISLSGNEPEAAGSPFDDE